MYHIIAEYDLDTQIHSDDAIRKAAGCHEDGGGQGYFTGERDLTWRRVKKQAALKLFSKLTKLSGLSVTLMKD